MLMDSFEKNERIGGCFWRQLPLEDASLASKSFWGQVEGRLLAMLECEHVLTLIPQTTRSPSPPSS